MTQPQLPSASRPRLVADVLLRFWGASSLLIASALLVLNLAQLKQDQIRDADQLVALVHASLLIALPQPRMDALLNNTLNTLHWSQQKGLNMVLLLDQQGRIIYTSRPTGWPLNIDDPLLSLASTEDQDVQRVVRCFRDKQSDCLAIRSRDDDFHSSSWSVIRPVEVPSQQRQTSLPRQRLLAVINYDKDGVLARLTRDLGVILPFAALLAGLLCLVLGSTLLGQLLPRLRDEAQTDGLTQLMNRSRFMELAKELLAEAEQSGAEMVFTILDLDHFKRINDTYGHVCGDAALAHVGELLAIVSRPEDLLCRFGGEEFALLLRGSRDTGAKHLERLRLQLEMTRLNHGGHQIQLRASFGAAASSACGYNLDYLYSCADQALYAVKQSGRNRVGWDHEERLNRLAR
jgi:diguanylate cyclase (GGDEF)-like protein